MLVSNCYGTSMLFSAEGSNSRIHQQQLLRPRKCGWFVLTVYLVPREVNTAINRSAVFGAFTHFSYRLGAKVFLLFQILN